MIATNFLTTTTVLARLGGLTMTLRSSAVYSAPKKMPNASLSGGFAAKNGDSNE